MKQQKQTNLTRVQRRKSETVDRLVRRHRTTKRHGVTGSNDRLRVTPLGGQNGIGEKNMIVLEYGNDALVLDCGFDLGIDLPGINYAIPAADYLATIQHKLRGYVISHGHMDHIGALTHVVPQYPAPIFGSQFTIGMVNVQFEKATENGLTFVPECQVVDMDAHERVALGDMTIELIRVTHSVPESSAIVIDTPAGRVINTGDFRLDPEPLDAKPTDIQRLKQLGDEGVLLLMSESTNTTRQGRTPTEHTLQASFETIIEQAAGRVFIAVFSTNMNRIQMIIDAAARQGRKVALDGRSMIAVAELAVRLGNLKIPKDCLIPMRDTPGVPDNRLVVICTGGQGEPGAALSRMSAGEHQYLKLKKTDSVVVSSTPIPGNENSYQQVGDDLTTIGVTLFRHPTHEIDHCGPLHVSGHAARDEHAEMIRLTRPKYLMPIYGGALNRRYHHDIGLEQRMSSDHILMVDNGEVIEFNKHSIPKIIGSVTAGALLVDQTGNVVPELVTKDRLSLRDDGFVVVIVTLDKRTGKAVASPDVITRGVISIRDNAELMESLRTRIRQASSINRRATKQMTDDLRQALKTAVGEYVYATTRKTPLVIPVVNIIGSHSQNNTIPRPVSDSCAVA